MKTDLIYVLRALFALFHTTSPAGKVTVKDFGRLLISYLLHSGAILAVLQVLAADASVVVPGGPLAVALVSGLAKLAIDLLHTFASGPKPA